MIRSLNKQKRVWLIRNIKPWDSVMGATNKRLMACVHAKVWRPVAIGMATFKNIIEELKEEARENL